MVQYTLAQSPEIILTVSGKDSAKARNKAMDQLMELMDAGKLPTELEEGFGPQQLIEVKEPSIDTANGEDTITQAVQILSNLATLKLKVQESRAEALEIRKALDVLFADESVNEEEITRFIVENTPADFIKDHAIYKTEIDQQVRSLSFNQHSVKANSLSPDQIEAFKKSEVSEQKDGSNGLYPLSEYGKNVQEYYKDSESQRRPIVPPQPENNRRSHSSNIHNNANGRM